MSVSPGRGCERTSRPSAEHVAHPLAWWIIKQSRLRNKQSTCQLDQSITKKTLFLLCSVGVRRWGKETWRVSPQMEPQEKLHSFCRKPYPPLGTQPFTSGSYRAIEHSPGTSTSPTSATKSILKQHSPQFPHYFTCQMLTKQSRKAKASSGAPQHTSCQPRPY